MNKQLIKKILKYASLSTIALTLVMSVVCLINYYGYVSIINKITDPNLNMLAKFDLQEMRDAKLYACLSSLIWTAYIALITAAINITNFFVSNQKQIINKTR